MWSICIPIRCRELEGTLCSCWGSQYVPLCQSAFLGYMWECDKKLFSLSIRHILLHSTPQWLSTLAEGDIQREFAFSNITRVIFFFFFLKLPQAYFWIFVKVSDFIFFFLPRSLLCIFSYSFLLQLTTTLHGHFREVKTYEIWHNEIMRGEHSFPWSPSTSFSFLGWNISLKGSTEYFNTL